MAKNFYSFDQFVSENYENMEKNVDFSVIAPQFFNNGFNLGESWFKLWVDKNDFAVETHDEDPNFLNVYDQLGKWVGSFDQPKGKIFTNRTMPELHESFSTEEFEEVYEASIAKIQKDHAKVVGKMKKLADEYKKDKGNTKIVDQLKALTKEKKALEAALDAAVAVDDTYSESVTEKKDHILIIKTKDGKEHKSMPMEKSLADQALKVMNKRSKSKEFDSASVMKVESAEVNEGVDTSIADQMIQEAFDSKKKLTDSLIDAKDALKAMYESDNLDPEKFDAIIADLEAVKTGI